MNANTIPSESVLQDLVGRIVDAVHPLRIILFGSSARGEMGPDSDLDVLVVVPDASKSLETEKRVIRSLRGLGLPKDIVVVSQTDVRRFGTNPFLIIHTALQEGRELYHAPG